MMQSTPTFESPSAATHKTPDFVLKTRDDIRNSLQASSSNHRNNMLKECVKAAAKNSDFEKYITAPKPGAYDRAVIYTDPAFYFSLMMLTWAPGAKTPIHGHNSYGFVGICSGKIAVECFERVNLGDSQFSIVPNYSCVSNAGDVADAHSGAAGIHRLSNPTTRQAVSLHLYRMDLSEDPTAINDVYEERRLPSL